MDLLFNSALALLMFSLGLHLDWKDFHQHIKQPKKLLIGLGTQLILPISITLLLMMIFQLD
jgi:predicted Na+-dependent transporter